MVVTRWPGRGGNALDAVNFFWSISSGQVLLVWGLGLGDGLGDRARRCLAQRVSRPAGARVQVRGVPVWAHLARPSRSAFFSGEALNSRHLAQARSGNQVE